MASQLTASPVLPNNLHEGYLHKKGKLNKSWKNRYFILCRDRKLKYYSTKPSTTSDKEIGFINLHLVTGISTHKFDNTNIIYDLNNPNIKKNSTYYEEQKTYHTLKEKQKIQKNIKRSNSHEMSSEMVGHEFIFKLYTPKRIWHLKCTDAPSMNEWTTKVKETVYGNILYEAHLLIDIGNKWKSRWCVLTDKYHLRLYEDETQSKYKNCVRMEQLNMITYNDRDRFRYFNNRREYAVKLSRSDKQFQIAMLSHKSRQVWMDKFSYLMQDELHEMEILREGSVWIFEQCEDGLKRWDKRYCGIDASNYLYFADDFDVFRCFTNGLYFDLNVFEEEKRNQLDGYLCLFENENRFKCGYASNYQIFNGTTQEHNNNIFYIKFKQPIKVEKNDCEILNFATNIIYFATTSSVELKSWIQCLSSLQRAYYKKHAKMTAILENDKYETKIDDEQDKYAQIQSMMEAMPFYSSSRISISITQSCIDMEPNMHDIVSKKEAVWSNTWKEMNTLCNGYIECEDECKSITECPCFQRISFIMQFYDDWCCTKKQLLLLIKSPKSPVTRRDHNIEEGIYDYLNDYFEGYSTLKLINDYYHIYSYHKYNDADFEFIYLHLPNVNYASENQKCNVLMCDMIRRNERCRGLTKISYFGYTDLKQITCMQILDRIHSVLYHSFDLFRLNSKEKALINENMTAVDHDESSGNDSEDSNQSNDKNIDHDNNFYKMHKIMQSKQTKLIQIRTQFNRNCNKFLTDVPLYYNEDEDDECENKNDDEDTKKSTFVLHGFSNVNKHGRSQSVQSLKKKPKFNKLGTLDTSLLNIGSLSHGNNENMNNFGVKFTYYKQDKKLDENAIYITAKYANLKQEILSNVLCCIERMDWDETFFIAQNFMQCTHVKSYMADLTETQVKKYKIGDGDGLILNHLQSLLLYCNYSDTLHKNLTFTFRKYSHTNNKDILSYNELRKRHSEFVNWAKYLTEVVTIFGKNIHKTSEFYHGMQSKYKFNDFHIYYAYPISVTQKLNIATHFVNKKGIILSLNRSEMMSGPKIINCAFLSDMEYEEEVLLMFCNARPLKITSIIELNTSYSYYYHLCAINILHDIINGRKINKMKVKALNRLYQLLQYKFNTFATDSVDENVSYDELKMGYIYKLFVSFCNHQDNLIKFDVKLIKNISNVSSFFIDVNDENCLKMDSLIKLFPNSKAFEIKCPVLHLQTFESIIKLLNEGLIQNINSQIYQITFKWVQQGNIDNIIEKYGEEFEKYNWSIKKKHKYGFDYINITRNFTN